MALPLEPARPARRRRRPPGRALAALLGACLVLGPAAACSREPAPPPAPPTCALPDPVPTLAAGSLALPADPAVLVLGDSYTEGYGAEPETKGWAYLVGDPLGWRVTVDGVGGSGFVNPGPRGQGSYSERLPAHAGQRFDLVVLQGGSNDRDAGFPALQDAVARTVDAVRAQVPGTAVLLVGPATPYGRPDPPRLLAQCVLAGYADRQGLAFVDPVGEAWFAEGDGERNANPANGHPSNAGYRVMAERFVADVDVLLGTAPS